MRSNVLKKYIFITIVLLSFCLVFVRCVVEDAENKYTKGNNNIVYLDINMLSKGGSSTNNDHSIKDTIYKKAANPGDLDTVIVQQYKYPIKPFGLSNAEYNIKNVVLVVFDSDRCEKVYHQELVNSTKEYNLKINTSITGNKKTIYAFVNINDTSVIQQLKNFEILKLKKDKIKEIEYDLSYYIDRVTSDINSSYLLPAYGEKEINIPADTKTGTTFPCQMNIDRSVARVDVFLEKIIPDEIIIKGETRLYVSNRINGYFAPYNVKDNSIEEPYDLMYYGPENNVYIQEPDTTQWYINIGTPNEKEVILITRGLERIYSYYIPEISIVNEDNRLHFKLFNVFFGNGSRKEYEVIIGNEKDNVVTKFERNKVYRVDCRIIGDKSGDIEAYISASNWKEWSDEFIIKK